MVSSTTTTGELKSTAMTSFKSEDGFRTEGVMDLLVLVYQGCVPRAPSLRPGGLRAGEAMFRVRRHRVSFFFSFPAVCSSIVLGETGVAAAKCVC